MQFKQQTTFEKNSFQEKNLFFTRSYYTHYRGCCVCWCRGYWLAGWLACWLAVWLAGCLACLLFHLSHSADCCCFSQRGIVRAFGFQIHRGVVRTFVFHFHCFLTVVLLLHLVFKLCCFCHRGFVRAWWLGLLGLTLGLTLALFSSRLSRFRLRMLLTHQRSWIKLRLKSDWLRLKSDWSMFTTFQIWLTC